MEVETSQNNGTQQLKEKMAAPDAAITPSASSENPAGGEDESIKHPLQNNWTMWYNNPHKKTSQKSYADFLQKIVTISTVEDFWGLFNNIVTASKLPTGTDYHLFKEGLEPKWEDPQNKNGGKWVVSIPKTKREHLDQLWLYVLLACIGEAFEDEEEVCGVVVSVRTKQDRIALWTRTASNEAATKRIGAQMKQVLEMPSNVLLGYQLHEDALKRDSSFNNKNYYEV